MRRLFLSGVFFFSFLLAISQNLSTILDKHFEAHGQKLWDQVETVVIEGKWVNSSFDKFPIKIIYKSPDKLRIQGYWNEEKFVEATNGKIAWIVAPWTGTSLVKYMTPLEHLIIENSYSRGSGLKTYQNSLSLSGLEFYENELFIKLNYKDDLFERFFYLGKDDYILYWEEVKSKVGDQHQLKKQYEKYKNFQGLLSPTAVRISTNDEEKELIFENVALGAGANNKIFEMPKSQ